MITYFVPVVNKDNKPLMPTNLGRAKRWIALKKATPFYKKGIFCVRLNIKTDENIQQIVIGVDPGIKQEGYTIKSASHTYLNLQADAIDWVKGAMKSRRNARHGKRNRKTPYRKVRLNRNIGGIPPSIKARYNWKIRLIDWFKKIFPIDKIIVEDIKARSTGKPKFDLSFGPLQRGKNYFYTRVKCITKQGYETKALRDVLGLTKSKDKLSKDFSAHCVDSWVLANSVTGGHIRPDNTKVIYIRPLRFHRRQLHVFVAGSNGKRRTYGGTRSLGFKRGSLVKHNKLGIVYIGGHMNGKLSLHSFNGKRLGQKFNKEDCKFLCYASWICQTSKS